MRFGAGHFPGKGKLQLWVPPVLAALAVVLIVVVQGWALWGRYQAIWQLETNSAENTLRTIAANIERNLDVIGLALERLAAGAVDPSISALPPEIRSKVLFDSSVRASGFGAMLVIDPRGQILADSAADPPRVASLADRDYFKAQLAPDAGLFVSAPFPSRISNGEPSVAISRRLTDADGRFAGVAVATVRVSYFRSLFENLTLRQGHTIVLLNADGTPIYGYPASDNVAADGARRLALRGGLSEAGVWQAEAPGDEGGNRYLLSHRISGYPLVLVMAISSVGALEGWYQQLAVSAAVVLCTLLIVVFTIRTLHLALLRSREMEAMLQRLSLTDALTGLPNRRACDLMLAHEALRAARDKTELSVAMIDIDYFKRVNDRYGHQIGDRVIARVAATIEATARRAGDYAARYGGEEFMLILPSTGADGALFLAERVRRAIEGQDLQAEAPGLSGVTISIGLATRSVDDASTIEDLVQKADRALYNAKSSGRNRVVAASAREEPAAEYRRVSDPA